MKVLHCGTSVFCWKGNIVSSVWNVKKAVAFISTQCNAKGNQTMHRKQKDGTYIEVSSLPVVKLYNQYMVKVKHSVQMWQYYDTQRANRWWQLLLWFCLDVSIVNAHILTQIADNHPNFTQLQFHFQMEKMLISNLSSR